MPIPRERNAYTQSLFVSHCKGREVEARFAGGAITSNGGAVLLRQADRMLGLTEQAARVLDDPRRKASCRHSARSMLRQRVFGLALGYEDLNDHDELRSDPALQTAVGAVVLHNTRRVRLLLSSSCPHQTLFFAAAARLRPG